MNQWVVIAVKGGGKDSPRSWGFSGIRWFGGEEIISPSWGQRELFAGMARMQLKQLVKGMFGVMVGNIGQFIVEWILLVINFLVVTEKRIYWTEVTSSREKLWEPSMVDLRHKSQTLDLIRTLSTYLCFFAFCFVLALFFSYCEWTLFIWQRKNMVTCRFYENNPKEAWSRLAWFGYHFWVNICGPSWSHAFPCR